MIGSLGLSGAAALAIFLAEINLIALSSWPLPVMLLLMIATFLVPYVAEGKFFSGGHGYEYNHDENGKIGAAALTAGHVSADANTDDNDMELEEDANANANANDNDNDDDDDANDPVVLV